jgi:hypothetical protein
MYTVGHLKNTSSYSNFVLGKLMSPLYPKKKIKNSSLIKAEVSQFPLSWILDIVF